MTGDVAAVVLAYGDGPYAAVVADLAGQGVDPAAIVVVQNPRAPAEPALVPPVDGVAVLRMERNGGYAAAMNAGMRRQLERGARHVLLLTHDVRLRPGCVAALAAAAQRAPRHAAIGPVLELPDGQPFSYGGRVRADGEVTHRRAPEPDPSAEGLGTAEFLDGAAMLVSADAWREVGPLDERFFLYYEETDWCVRAARAGRRVGVALDARAVQSPGTAQRPGATAFLFARNGLAFSGRVAGARGVAAELGRQALVARSGLKAAVTGPGAEGRRAGRARMAGVAAGVGAFALRRWGPPPRRLPGMGDVRV